MNSQRVVLITGCSSGVGLASAVRLAKDGFKVYATMRELAKQDQLQEAAAVQGLSVAVEALDVTDGESVHAAVERVLTQAGRIDGVVNNAAYPTAGFLEDFAVDEVRAQLETNTLGAFRVIQAVLPAMRRQRSGTIVNVSSLGGRISMPCNGVYCLSKFALEALTEAWRMELRPFGIAVTSVRPGLIDTQFVNSVRLPRGFDDSSPYHQPTRHFLSAPERMPKGVSPDKVAKVIARALATKRPKRTYLVGRDAKLLSVAASILPARLLERFFARMALGDWQPQ